MSGHEKKILPGLFKYPWLILLVIGIITVFFAFQLPRAELDNNNIRFVPEDDEARVISGNIDDIFGSSLFILVGLERRYGDVFEPAFLGRIREFTARMEEMEIVGKVSSIVSSDYISGTGDSVVVEKLAPDTFSGSPGEILELRRRLLSWDMYRRSLISDDFKATQILVPMNITSEAASRPEVIGSFIEIRDIAKEMFAGYGDVYVTGLPLISAVINEAMHADLVLMIPLVIVVVLAILFFSFRRLTGVILPLLTVVIAVIWSVGAMPLFGIKLSVVTTVLPVILVAVGSAYGIHVITHYLEAVSVKKGMTREEHTELVLDLLRIIGKAVFLAALTTFAGFASFCFTSVLPIREFGFFSSFGVIASFGVAVTMIPALLIVRGPEVKKGLAEKRGKGSEDIDVIIDPRTQALPEYQGDSVDNGVANFFTAIAQKRGAVLTATVIVVLVSVYGVTKVEIDNIFVEYFKTSTDIYRSDRFIREKFGGSKVVSIMASAETPEEILGPDSLSAMDGLASYLGTIPEVGKVMGFTDLVKRVNQVFNVDESPDGIAPAPDTGGSGGGDGFGFGDFGFGFDDAGEGGGTAAGFGEGAAPQPPAESPLLKEMTAAQFVDLLQRAAGSGKDRYMYAEDLTRQVERLLNYEGMAYYEIPSDPERYGKTSKEELQRLVSNYLILLSGDISSYANDPLEPTAIKSTVQLRTLGEADTGRVIDRIHQYIADNFPENIKTVVGGSALVEASLNRLVVESQILSVIISIILVFVIIAVSNKSVPAGIIGIAPLSISILINFAVMGFLGIKLNIGTSMVASVSVGIGIDYTIHYLEAYKREYLATKGTGRFLKKTFAISGKAILINAVSVGAGFAVLLFSQFVMLEDLGLLIALTMGTSAVISLTVLPVLLSLIKPKFVFAGEKHE
jgi:predicted RND superfamily exporter protein